MFQVLLASIWLSLEEASLLRPAETSGFDALDGSVLTDVPEQSSVPDSFSWSANKDLFKVFDKYSR